MNPLQQLASDHYVSELYLLTPASRSLIFLFLNLWLLVPPETGDRHFIRLSFRSESSGSTGLAGSSCSPSV